MTSESDALIFFWNALTASTAHLSIMIERALDFLALMRSLMWPASSGSGYVMEPKVRPIASCIRRAPLYMRAISAKTSFDPLRAISNSSCSSSSLNAT